MSLPALPVTADTRSITERVNVLIRDYNNPLPPQRLVPAGVVLPFAGAVAPAGFLLCDGQAVSRTDHADLFAAIGTTYGAGDGSTTFNVPDLRGRVVAGPDGGTGRLSFATTVGVAGGAQTHALTAAQNGPHAHPGAAGANFALANAGTAFGFTTTSGNYIGFTSTTGSSGSGAPHNNVQPTIILNHVIST